MLFESECVDKTTAVDIAVVAVVVMHTFSTLLFLLSNYAAYRFPSARYGTKSFGPSLCFQLLVVAYAITATTCHYEQSFIPVQPSIFILPHKKRVSGRTNGETGRPASYRDRRPIASSSITTASVSIVNGLQALLLASPHWRRTAVGPRALYLALLQVAATVAKLF